MIMVMIVQGNDDLKDNILIIGSYVLCSDNIVKNGYYVMLVLYDK